MISPQDVVTEARSWMGPPATPYAHQGRIKGVAVDCIGLLIGVAKSLHLPTANFDVSGYPRSPDGKTLRAGCDARLKPVTKSRMALGHALLLRFEDEPQHMAIVADDGRGRLTMIHALQKNRRVDEHRIDATWMKRIVQVYEFPGVEYV